MSQALRTLLLESDDSQAIFDQRGFQDRARLYTHVEGDSMTDVSQQEQTDINRIFETYRRIGTLPASNKQPYYGDVTAMQGDRMEVINNLNALQTDIESEINRLREEEISKQNRANQREMHSNEQQPNSQGLPNNPDQQPIKPN